MHGTLPELECDLVRNLRAAAAAGVDVAVSLTPGLVLSPGEFIMPTSAAAAAAAAAECSRAADIRASSTPADDDDDILAMSISYE